MKPEVLEGIVAKIMEKAGEPVELMGALQSLRDENTAAITATNDTTNWKAKHDALMEQYKTTFLNVSNPPPAKEAEKTKVKTFDELFK